MLVDYQGNLWFTSSRLGLLRMASSDFRDIYTTAGMDNRVTNTIVQWNGVYYFGTDKGMEGEAPRAERADGTLYRDPHPLHDRGRREPPVGLHPERRAGGV